MAPMPVRNSSGSGAGPGGWGWGREKIIKHKTNELVLGGTVKENPIRLYR